MKRLLFTLVAALVCLVGVVQLKASAQPGPVHSSKIAAVTPQRIAELLRQAGNKVKVEQAQECTLVTSSLGFSYQGKQWSAPIEIEVHQDRIELVSPLAKLDELTKSQLDQVMRIKLPAGQEFHTDNGWLVLDAMLSRSLSEVEIIRQIESLLGSVAQTHPTWNPQKKAPNAAPQANPMPAPQAPKADANVPHGAPSIEVIKAIVEKKCSGIAYTDTTTKETFAYKSIRFGTKFQRAFYSPVSGGNVLIDMYPVALEFHRTENWADGTTRTVVHSETFQFFRNNGEWQCYRIANK